MRDDEDDEPSFGEYYGGSTINPDLETYSRDDLLDEIVDAMGLWPDFRSDLETFLIRAQMAESDEEFAEVEDDYYMWELGAGGGDV